MPLGVAQFLQPRAQTLDVHRRRTTAGGFLQQSENLRTSYDEGAAIQEIDTTFVPDKSKHLNRRMALCWGVISHLERGDLPHNKTEAWYIQELA